MERQGRKKGEGSIRVSGGDSLTPRLKSPFIREIKRRFIVPYVFESEAFNVVAHA